MKTAAAVLFFAAGLLAAPFARAQEVQQMVFTDEDVTVPPVVQSRINDYTDLVVNRQLAVLTSLQAALNNFETAMSFASAQAGNPQVINAMASSLFRQFASAVSEELPGVSMLAESVNAAAEEMERAALARSSYQLGDWIRTQRSAIDRLQRTLGSRAHRQELSGEIELAYLGRDDAGREDFFYRLNTAVQAMSRGDDGPDIDELELGLYERWIIAHYGSNGYEMTGLVDFRLRYDTRTRTVVPLSVHALAPYADHMEAPLNALMRRGLTPVRRPFELRVMKIACVLGPGVSGGANFDCAFFNDRGRMVGDPPITPVGRAVLRMEEWRNAEGFSVPN